MNRVEMKQQYLIMLLNYLQGEVYVWADIFFDEPLISFKPGKKGVVIETLVDKPTYERYRRYSNAQNEVPSYYDLSIASSFQVRQLYHLFLQFFKYSKIPSKFVPITGLIVTLISDQNPL